MSRESLCVGQELYLINIRAGAGVVLAQGVEIGKVFGFIAVLSFGLSLGLVIVLGFGLGLRIGIGLQLG